MATAGSIEKHWWWQEPNLESFSYGVAVPITKLLMTLITPSVILSVLFRHNLASFALMGVDNKS